MTFSANQAPMTFTQLKSVFSLTAVGTVNLGQSAIRNMRSATATASANATISLGNLRGKGVINMSAAGSGVEVGYKEGSFGAINNTSMFGRTIKGLYFSGGGGFDAPFLTISGSASSGTLGHLYFLDGASYTAATVTNFAVSPTETQWRFSGFLGLTNGAAGTNLTFYFD